MAEAGAGKTEEIGAATQKLRTSGKTAFFLRLEHLASGFEHAFEIGDADEFEEWYVSDQPGWFFLDSVDEARLTGPKKFEEAIRKFATRLGDARSRAYVYVTGRITEWRPNSDLKLIRDRLSITKEVAEQSDQVEPTEVSQGQVDGTVVNPERKDEIVEPRIYSLQPLDNQQIRIFAEASPIYSS